MADYGDFSLITVVSNLGGCGPGHSALSIAQTVYSVEVWNMNIWKSAWLVMSLDDYRKHVQQRPMIFQNLNNKVDKGRCLSYIQSSQTADDDYLTDGVCSSQAGAAIEAGLVSGGRFDASFGFDLPFEVFVHAYDLGIVASTYFEWRDEDKCSAAKRHNLGEKIECDFRPYFNKYGVVGARESYLHELPSSGTPRGPTKPPAPLPGTPGPRRGGRTSAHH